jgi:hypothetical protein
MCGSATRTVDHGPAVSHSLVSLSPCANKRIRGSRFEAAPTVGLGGGLPWSPLLHSNQGQTYCRICPRFKYDCPRLKGNDIGVKSRQIIENTRSSVRDLSTARQPSLLAQLSRCTQIPEYAQIGCFAALKPRNLPGCLYSKAGINLLQRTGIRSIWQLNPGRTSDGTLSGI